MTHTNQAKQRIAVLLVFLLTFMAQTKVQSQVVVGANAPLSSYTILQLEGIGGLRLPRMTTTGRDTNLTPLLGKDASAGLMIYNETEDCIEFWDGEMWNPLKVHSGLNNSKNGVKGNGTTASPFKLGGDIVDPVTINQDGNNLFFDATSGMFVISNTTAFMATTTGVGVGTSTPTAALDIHSASIGKGFRYNDGTASADFALTSDKDGNANWQAIRFDPVEKKVDVLDNVLISSTTRNNPVQISQPLALDKGIWLVSARYVASSGSSASYLGYNAWLRLRSVGSSTDVNCVGIVPQFINNTLLATPQFSFLLQVPEGGKTYALYGDIYDSTDNTGRRMYVSKNNSTYGDSYFKAVKLSNVIY